MKTSQLKAGVILSYLSKSLSTVIELAYTPVMLRLLGQSEYGLYSLTSSVVSYLGLLTFGMSGAYLRFYARERVDKGEDGVARLNGMFLLVFSAIGFFYVKNRGKSSVAPRFIPKVLEPGEEEGAAQPPRKE